VVDDGRQYRDEFAVAGADDGQSGFGMSRRIGTSEIRRGAAFGEVADKVDPPRDAAMNHESRLVRVR
jgi:hypothetical protein